jgi:hypothetical protein
MATLFAKVMGPVLLLVGVAGFVPALAPEGMLLGLFMVNALHNVVHLASGAVFLWAAFSGTAETARATALGFGIVYGLVTVLGFATGGVFGLMSVNMADNVLHLGITLAALGVGLMKPAAGPQATAA